MQRIVAPDSPLIRLPETLPPVQASFFDAVRLSAQFVDAAYERIEKALNQVVTPEHDRSPAILPIAFMDAWSIVDTVRRLRQLLNQLPGYRNRAPSKSLFFKRTEAVEELRNAFQHLVGEITQLTEADLPVLGSLTWMRPVDSEQQTLTTWSFMPGRVRNLHPSAATQLPSEVPTGISQIELWLSDKSVNISKIRSAVADVVGAFEKSLRKPPESQTTLCDALTFVKVELLPPEQTPA